MKSLAITIVLGSILLLVVVHERWKWQECRKVGHGWLYCFTEQAK